MVENALLRELPAYDRQRVVVFIDGQNLYYTCREHFGHPLAHPHLLAQRLSAGRRLIETRFYTGVHDPRKYPEQHGRVDRRLKLMQTRGVTTIERRLSYVRKWIPSRDQDLPPPGDNLGKTMPGSLIAMEVGSEKGIDLALGLDLVRFAREGRYDVAILVSRDRDLHEAVNEVHAIGAEKREALEVELVMATVGNYGHFSSSPPFDRVRWLTRPVFDECRDDTDYSAPLGGAGPSGVAAKDPDQPA